MSAKYPRVLSLDSGDLLDSGNGVDMDLSNPAEGDKDARL